jgi:hypothetical protein
LAWERIETIANTKVINIGLVDFFNIVGHIVDVDNKQIADQEDRILYEAAYPDYIINETSSMTQIPSNIITYSTVTRDPGPIGSKRQLRPIDAARYRNTVTDELWSLLLMRYETKIRFDAFAPSASEVEKLIIRWEKFMDLHMQMIEYVGLERIWYTGRGLSLTTMRSGYHNRSATYNIITQEQIWRKDIPIKEIVLAYGLHEANSKVIEFPDLTTGNT